MAGIQKNLKIVVSIVNLARNRFSSIDGDYRAGAFAYFMLFSLFPAIVLFIIVASVFIDRAGASSIVLRYIDNYIPISNQLNRQLFDTISGSTKVLKHSGILMFLMMVWGAMEVIKVLIHATNRAWGVADTKWWQLQMKSLILLGVVTAVVLSGMVVPVVGKMAKGVWFPAHELLSASYSFAGIIVPMIVVFFGLVLFYRLAPGRKTTFSEVWIAALLATILLRAGEVLFIVYMKHFPVFKTIYGAFGGIMALMLWIFISGSIYISGACLCAAQKEVSWKT